MIGRITRLQLHDIWKHEAYDFTTWLEKNIDVLNDLLDMTLSGVEREKSAGKFSVDLVAEDDMGNPVIIENQLDKSNHDHLGKIITYSTVIGAKVAIWIVADPRPEHVSAISWLNESSSVSFYLLKVEAIKIGDSEPAPLLTVIVRPSEEVRDVGDKKKDLAERHILRGRYWTQLLDYEKTKIHANISPSNYNWIGTSAGRQGLGYNYSVTQHESAVELYIDKGKESGEQNKSIFDKLYESKDEIESVFGEPLDWQRLNDRRGCRIKKQITIGGYRDDERKWPKTHEAMVDAMIRLEKALKPHINKLSM